MKDERIYRTVTDQGVFSGPARVEHRFTDYEIEARTMLALEAIAATLAAIDLTGGAR